MANWNNKQNRSVRRGIDSSLDLALSMFYRGDKKRAEEFLSQARLAFSVRGASGSEWERLRLKFRRIAEILKELCHCWTCQMSPEQRSTVEGQTAQKLEQLSIVYQNQENNFTGAFAEVVFGVRYGLKINLRHGFDGGVDFTIPCIRSSNGLATIDVKGTTTGGISSTEMRCSFPFQNHWKNAANHIYVLLQVLGRKHVFFRGFAYGDDPAIPQHSYVGAGYQHWFAPRPDRSLSELDEFLANKEGSPLESRKLHNSQSAIVSAKVELIRSAPQSPINPNTRMYRDAEGNVSVHRSRFVVEMKVRHAVYGDGVVVKTGIYKFLNLLDNWDEEVQVNFRDRERTLFAGLAGLARLDLP